MIDQLRERMVEVVTESLTRVSAGAGLQVHEGDVSTMARALVGAAEALADWTVAHPDADPDVTATRLMNAVWLGAGQLLRGHTWRAGRKEGSLRHAFCMKGPCDRCRRGGGGPWRRRASAKRVASVAKPTVAGSRIGSLNGLHSGRFVVERGQAAGQAPHAVRDRTREAEQPRGQP